MGTAETQQLTGIAAHIIKRPRLTKILDESEARIILLCAPAGYGKTTLAREWVATRSEPVYWYSGGPAMADVAALAVGLAELLDGEHLARTEHVQALVARGETPASVATALAAAMSDRCLVVLDDFHHAVEREDPQALVREMLKRSDCRLVITSRVRPKWITARSVVYGEALVVDTRDLAFSDEEAARVLPELEQVREHARGWPAVIGLAAMSCRAGAPPAPLDPSELYEYLAEDMFSSVEEPSRLDLLILALGGDASPDTASALLGDRLDQRIRDALDRGFVIPDGGGWVTMHPLLRDFLARKTAELEPALRLELVDAVLQVLVARHTWDRCLPLLRRFPQSQMAVEAMRAALDEMLTAGRTATVSEWAEWAAAAGIVDPLFTLAQAEVSLRQGKYTEARPLATEAGRLLSGDLAARAFLAAARAGHQLDLHEETREDARRARELATSQELRTEALWLEFANAYERGGNELGQALERLQALEDPRPEHSLRLACAEAFVEVGPDGDLTRALDAAERAVALGRIVRDPYLRTNALNLRAHLLRCLARYEATLHAVDELADEAERAGLEFVLDHARVARAGALIGLRLFSEARSTVRELDRSTPLRTPNTYVRCNTLMVKARLQIATGDLDAAIAMMNVQPPPVPTALRDEMISLRMLLAAARSGEFDSRARETAEPQDYIEALATAHLSKAIVNCHRPAEEAGDTAATITRILERGCADAVVVACRAYPRLAAVAVQGGAESQLRSLFVSSRDYDLGRRAGISMPRSSRRAPGLTKREVEILELLAEGKSNPEIARVLFISESTTKVHVRHIFDKLGVRTRAEAVAVGLARSSNLGR